MIKRRENSAHIPSSSTVKDLDTTVDFKAIPAKGLSTDRQTPSAKSKVVDRTHQGAHNYYLAD